MVNWVQLNKTILDWIQYLVIPLCLYSIIYSPDSSRWLWDRRAPGHMSFCRRMVTLLCLYCCDVPQASLLSEQSELMGMWPAHPISCHCTLSWRKIIKIINTLKAWSMPTRHHWFSLKSKMYNQNKEKAIIQLCIMSKEAIFGLEKSSNNLPGGSQEEKLSKC